MYTTTTTHCLCCSGSAAGIVFGTFYPSVVCMLLMNADPVLGVTDAIVTSTRAVQHCCYYYKYYSSTRYNTDVIITSTTAVQH